jgi:hypothetical protein
MLKSLFCGKSKSQSDQRRLFANTHDRSLCASLCVSLCVALVRKSGQLSS